MLVTSSFTKQAQLSKNYPQQHGNKQIVVKCFGVTKNTWDLCHPQPSKSHAGCCLLSILRPPCGHDLLKHTFRFTGRQPQFHWSDSLKIISNRQFVVSLFWGNIVITMEVSTHCIRKKLVEKFINSWQKKIAVALPLFFLDIY